MTKPKSQSTKKDDEALVLEYLKKTNRPYSASEYSDICLNLHNAVAKSALTKILTALCDRGDVRCKTYGKQSVYVIDQDQFENPSPEELTIMDAKIEDLRQQIAVLQDKNKHMKQSLQLLTTQKTTAELQEISKDLDEKISILGNRLNSLQSGTVQLITVDEMQKIDKNYEQMRKIWKDRKALFRDLWDAVSEGVVSPSELKERLGIEDDEIDFSVDLLSGIR
ncbi:uncharacterized protein T551_02348 [Pneumocystis jirovecii RU7]|uniref:Homologous-pairing protein 2 homolog n=1 Tax=Pneumocystis jirovecii (strain RU7) TaxID=1408657 RepID=A0A0W4ZL19_PNEJ7|nr:uncharacterized protein T551_02348 [Pneumocystis jirovecii RU7]KTW29074.1 hypothetical protein T551_02348 [Pneumocystis jirovecii RU7]